MILDQLRMPIVLAPMAGGPSTPALTAAISHAGGLGFLAGGYLSASELAERISATRQLTESPFGVNVFVPGQPTDPATYRDYVTLLSVEGLRAGVTLGTPRCDDDDWTAKLELLTRMAVPVVSFTFGCPQPAVITGLRKAGSEVWVTVTRSAEARQAAAAGADVLVVQGSEAGGHQSRFVDTAAAASYPLAELLPQVRAVTELALVASGGIMTGAGIARAIASGARAAQLGTAFLLCPEAGTSPVHRAAVASREATELTRVFTGRLARGVRNRFMADYGPQAPIAYPEIHHVTAPLRKAGRETGDGDVVNLWAGTNHQLVRELPAAELLALLDAERHEQTRSAQRAI